MTKVLTIKINDYLKLIEHEHIKPPEHIKNINFDGDDIFKLKPEFIDSSEIKNENLEIFSFGVIVHLINTGFNEQTPSDPEAKFFIYSKEHKDKLTGLSTIGINNNIIVEPTEEVSFKQVVFNSVVDNFKNTIGLDLSEKVEYEAFCSAGTLFYENITKENSNKIGLVFAYFSNPSELNDEHGQWLTYVEIMKLVEDSVITLDNWSIMFLDQFVVNNPDKVII